MISTLRHTQRKTSDVNSAHPPPAPKLYREGKAPRGEQTSAGAETHPHLVAENGLLNVPKAHSPPQRGPADRDPASPRDLLHPAAGGICGAAGPAPPTARQMPDKGCDETQD